jgi:RNA polymerase sigma-70 factor (ECF subfamily)
MGQMLSTTDDNDLVTQAVRGDREAFRQLLERHYDMIYRIAYRYVGSPADAQDIAQDVCIRLAGRLGQFRNRSRFSTWLTSVAINQCRDSLRRRRASQELVQKYGVLRASSEADDADTETRSAWLHGALQTLEPRIRETVLLVLAEDLSHAEAAAILGCAESTVSWRMHVARKRLRAQMDKNDD